MNVCMITPFCLSNSHGTGVQLLRLFAEQKYIHLYWSSASGFSESENSLLLEEQFTWWKFSRGKGRIEQLMGLLGLSSVWRHDVLIGEAHKARLQRHYRCDVAYVVVIDETSARKAVSLLEHLGCPYVVHLMDLMHPRGLDPKTMHGFRRLFAGASAVFALSENIRQEVLKFPAPETRIFPIVRSTGQVARNAPVPGGPLRIVMVGSLYYRAGLHCLAQAWDELVRRHPHIELVYAGPQSQIDNHLPARLKKVLDYRGYRRHEEIENILLDCHLAYLPGPCLPVEKDKYSKYSIPSRLTDYLMAGLPTIAFLASNSAAEQFLLPVMPVAVRRATSPEALIEAVGRFVEYEHWQEASAAAHAFAVAQCSVEGAHRVLFEQLNRAAQVLKSPGLPG